jgi:hypothetical protein
MLDYCLWGWMMKEVYQTRVDTADGFFDRILDVAAYIKKYEDQPTEAHITRSSHWNFEVH